MPGEIRPSGAHSGFLFAAVNLAVSPPRRGRGNQEKVPTEGEDPYVDNSGFLFSNGRCMTMRDIYFFVGTQAELMKLFQVINVARSRGMNCSIISTGQNKLTNCPYLQKSHSVVDIDISNKPAKQKNASGYLPWFFGTARKGKRLLTDYFTLKKRKNALCVVHGDTLTTTMGAWICKSLKLPYVHIESGLRSFNFLSPFPEEFDRLYGSTYSDINFCPGAIHQQYAEKRFRGKAIDTVYNTGIETLYDALEENGSARHEQEPEDKYFMFMLHRQENIMNRKFVCRVVTQIVKMADKMPCVFIYHQQTKEKMEEYGVFNMLANHPNVTSLPRQEYTDFIKLTNHAEFVATDGCGNQQEFYYLGKPYLILRTSVEKNSEGLGWNAKVFGNDYEAISGFLEEYPQYIKPHVVPEVRPSEIIVDAIEEWFELRQVPDALFGEEMQNHNKQYQCLYSSSGVMSSKDSDS